MTRQRWYGVVVPLAAIVMVIVVLVIGGGGAAWLIGALAVGAVAVAARLFDNAPGTGRQRNRNRT